MDLRAALATALQRPELSSAEAILITERLRGAGYAVIPRDFFDRFEALHNEMLSVAEGFRTYQPEPKRPSTFRDSVPEE